MTTLDALNFLGGVTLMASDALASRRVHFKKYYYLWIVLRHFLPADLLEELCTAVVEVSSDGTLKLEDLFETHVLASSSPVASWIIRPRSVSTTLASYLQSFVRGLVWQRDHGVGVITYDTDPIEVGKMEALEGALLVSQFDLQSTASPYQLGKLSPEPLKTLLRTFLHVKDLFQPGLSLSFESIIAAAVEGVEIPLNGLLVKHLGDLCADADQWNEARAFYDRAELLFAKIKDPAWRRFVHSMRSIILQSRAAAVWNGRSAEAAGILFRQAISAADLRTATLAAANASWDSYVAETMAHSGFATSDPRTALIIAPQLLSTHDISSALQRSADQDYSGAQRLFWAALRRQIALGSTMDSRQTKAYYGRCLIDELRISKPRMRDTEQFWLGVRLLIESGIHSAAEKTVWSSTIVEAYVDAERVASAIALIDRAPGVAHERTLVIVVLFSAWLKLLPPDALDPATAMLQFLAAAAKDSEWSNFGRQNVGGPSLGGLKEVAERRPEFRSLARAEVVGAITATLTESDPNAISAALETALAYLDAFDRLALEEVVTATLSTLDKFTSGRGPWPAVRPALTFLSSAQSRLPCDHDAALLSRVASTLVRFSLETETENTRLMYLFRDINVNFVQEQVDVTRLNGVVLSLRKQALQINSTATVANIFALLYAPAVAQLDGVRDAIRGLKEILQSAATNKPSISFATAYEPLMLLSEGRKEIARYLSVRDAEVTTLVEPLLGPLLGIWHRASTNPLIFSGFSIPPPKGPNPTLVHNWTFASIGFARSLGQGQAMNDAMEKAARHPLLESSMAVARAIRVSAGDPVQIDVDAIRSEKKDAFYPALGQRLVTLPSLSPDLGQNVTRALLEQCFRLGPNGLDAGIFAAALGAGITVEATHPAAAAYRQRLDGNAELRLSLFPLFDRIRNFGRPN